LLSTLGKPGLVPRCVFSHNFLRTAHSVARNRFGFPLPASGFGPSTSLAPPEAPTTTTTTAPAAADPPPFQAARKKTLSSVLITPSDVPLILSPQAALRTSEIASAVIARIQAKKGVTLDLKPDVEGNNPKAADPDVLSSELEEEEEEEEEEEMDREEWLERSFEKLKRTVGLPELELRMFKTGDEAEEKDETPEGKLQYGGRRKRGWKKQAPQAEVPMPPGLPGMDLLELNMSSKELRKKFGMYSMARNDENARVSGTYIMSQLTAKAIVEYLAPHGNHELIELFPGPALVTREFLRRGGGRAICLEDDSRFNLAAKELRDAVGPRFLQIQGHVTGLGGYEAFDEVAGKIFDTLPQHPWSQVHPTINVVCTPPVAFQEYFVNRMCRLMAEKYLMYSAGRVKTHMIVRASLYERLVAKPGERAYNQTSFMTSVFADVKKIFTIPGENMFLSSSSPFLLVTLTPKAMPEIGTQFDVDVIGFVLRQLFLRKNLPLRTVIK